MVGVDGLRDRSSVRRTFFPAFDFAFFAFFALVFALPFPFFFVFCFFDTARRWGVCSRR